MLTNNDIIEYMNDPSNDSILIYNLREHSYVPDESICLHILTNECMDYVNMVVEYDITNGLEKYIIQSIETFLLNNNDITENQYKIMGYYFESIDCNKFINRITKLIMNTKDKKLKDFLGIWIGIDKELDKHNAYIINELIRMEKETSGCIIS